MPHQIYTITKVEIVAPYTLRLTFDDGVEKTIDLSPVLRGELYGPLRDLEFFNQVKLNQEIGTIVWPNEADFDPATLHDWDEVGAGMIEMASKWKENPKITFDSFSPYDAYGAGRTLMEAKEKMQVEAGKEKKAMLLTEVLPTVQQLSRNDKLHLVRILVDELDATNEIAPFEPNKVYHIYTPYNMYGVAHLLMEAFEKAKPKEGKVE